MYQDKIESETKALTANDKGRYNHPNVFIREKLQPLDFLLEEEGNDAAHIARDILSKRSNEDVLLMSKSIDSMLQVGENLLTTLSIKLLSTSPTRKAISLTQGRSLYLLCDYFDLTSIAIKKLKWCEMFATLALMQVAEIVGSKHRVYGEDDMSQAMKKHSKSFILDMAEETIDTIARAECLFDTKVNASATATKGAKSKASNIEPLKFAVIDLYISHYLHLNNKRAGKAIFEHLTSEGSKLLFLSYADEKQLQFSKWISEFLKGKLKIPFKK
jgi:hypothetical protein